LVDFSETPQIDNMNMIGSSGSQKLSGTLALQQGITSPVPPSAYQPQQNFSTAPVCFGLNPPCRLNS